jgi:UDP-N-acetylglucosamine--N-acetylmuramyl-(pentapeptide) pyrophosphoryl-undecaprenol N-acetylglucosamine transferase
VAEYREDIGVTTNGHIVLAAGGTGGHMVPAHALAQELRARGYEISLITDERGTGYPGLFGGVAKHVIPSATMSWRKPLSLFSGYRTLVDGRGRAERLFAQYKPSVVVGFGGYPSLPAVWAATRLEIPTLVHEQNAVLGRTNRWLSKRVDAIALSSRETSRIPPSARDKTVLTGNPVREDIIALREEPYSDLADDSIFRVLVLGGSQGAKILSDVVPSALTMLPTNLKRRLQVSQQCRQEDIASVRNLYAQEAIAADLFTYIEDMASELRFAHLVIARAGASTVAELACAGRPAIFVPLPIATDNHQFYNTRDMVKAGGARVIRQTEFTAAELAKQIQKMALTPLALANAAGCAAKVGQPDAVQKLADHVERLAGKTPKSMSDKLGMAA